MQFEIAGHGDKGDAAVGGRFARARACTLFCFHKKKSDLRSLDVGLGAVAHEGDGKPLFSLLVALLVKLGEYAVAPFLSRQRTGGTTTNEREQ
jgi:hypothetical protein